MSESAPKRQRRAAEAEEDELKDGHDEAMMDTDSPQQQQATPSHTIDLEAFAQQFRQIPVVVAYVFSFLSLHLVAALPQRLWRHVGCQITRLVMDTHDTAERRFWCGLSFSDAFEWGQWLTRLKSIVNRYPFALLIPGGTPVRRYARETHSLPYMRDKIVTALVEGHSEGRRAAAATATGQQAGSTLESIEFSKFDSSVTVDEAEGRTFRAAEQRSASLPPPIDPPPTLASLTSLTGLTGLCVGNGRHWQLPSLETVQIDGTVRRESLGELVATSRRLKELQVGCHPNVMTGMLAQIPKAAAGQPGPLSQLEDIGTLSMHASAAGLQRLQAVLVDRGCRSIKKLSVTLEDYRIDSRIFETLQAMEALTRTVCVRPDIPVGIRTRQDFELSLLCEVPTRPEPSPFVQKRLQQLAAASQRPCFTICSHRLTTTGPLDTASPAARSLAHCLTFPKAERVMINGDLEPDADESDPVVLDSMPPNAFPAASLLCSYSNKGLAISRRLVTKMPVVKSIFLHRPTEQAVAVLQALGGERELKSFHADFVKAGHLRTELPEDLGDGDAAGEFGIACVRSLLKIRGIKKLTFYPLASASFARLVEERTHGDTIEGIEGRYVIGWGEDYMRSFSYALTPDERRQVGRPIVAVEWCRWCKGREGCHDDDVLHVCVLSSVAGAG
ncbi:unnamed protein product [Vitrella brassicaformis CCMP3155]|uniref:Uncharacterized protein n=1 Tax=Vitrella brassicaformis (strain CCMP3155) TaxID=1169540 RepID=A0A0G4E8D4_VITBC|nr:unnamed protein product [Vitrella brassicaformis CCMP3155]|eukprot:CEL91699.1 unnamed protein product [Vitrella brassicaformis CCMP3155]